MSLQPFRRASLSLGPSSVQQWLHAIVISALFAVAYASFSDPTMAPLHSVNHTSNPRNETVSTHSNANKTTTQAPGSKFGLIVGLITLAIVIIVALICTYFYVKGKRYRAKEEALADKKAGPPKASSPREASIRVHGRAPLEDEQSLKSEVLEPVAPRPTPTNPFAGPPSVIPDPSADWLAQRGKA